MILVLVDYIEKLVIVIEFKFFGDFVGEVMDEFDVIKNNVIVVILCLYGFNVVDFVLVLFGLIFIIISGKIRRVVCVE